MEQEPPAQNGRESYYPAIAPRTNTIPLELPKATRVTLAWKTYLAAIITLPIAVRIAGLNLFASTIGMVLALVLVPVSHEGYIDLLIKKRRFLKAAAVARYLETQFPRRAGRYLYRRADALIMGGYTDEAKALLAELKHWTTIRSTRSWYWLRTAELAMALGDPASAHELLDEIAPENISPSRRWILFYEKAMAFYLQGLKDKSLEFFGKVVDGSPVQRKFLAAGRAAIALDLDLDPMSAIALLDSLKFDPKDIGLASLRIDAEYTAFSTQSACVGYLKKLINPETSMGPHTRSRLHFLLARCKAADGIPYDQDLQKALDECTGQGLKQRIIDFRASKESGNHHRT